MKLSRGAETALAHADAGRIQLGSPASPPVFRQSTLMFPTMDALREVDGTIHTYGRHGNPTTRALEQALCELEGAAGAMLTPSGLRAITTALLAVLQPGDHLLMTDSTYDSTRSFCDETLARLGIHTTYYDPQCGAKIEALIQPNTRAVYTESPGSLTFEVQDIPAISAVAHRHGTLVMLDNTWGTPLNFRSFQHGVDISLHAATKYIGGHSDLLMGAILTTEALYPKLRRFYRQLGVSVSADDAWLALRGLRTLSVRLKRHQHTAQLLAEWLGKQPEVAQVLSPAFPDAPGHELWRRDFTGACGLFSVVLHPVPNEALAAMLDGLKLFGMGYSWGGFESLILASEPASNRTATVWPFEGPLLRVHAGLEHVNDLIADLDAAFGRLRHAMRKSNAA